MVSERVHRAPQWLLQGDDLSGGPVKGHLTTLIWAQNSKTMHLHLSWQVKVPIAYYFVYHRL